MGQRVDAGTVIALFGDLGSGKTVFVQGLAEGLDVPADYYITSPSYTLINEYPGRHPLYHVDLYRLGNVSDIEDIGLYDILDANGVVAIEWADRLAPDLLADCLSVQLDASNDTTRTIRITGYGLNCVNLLRELENRQ